MGFLAASCLCLSVAGQVPFQPAFDPSVTGRSFKSPSSYLFGLYPGPGVHTGTQLRLTVGDAGASFDSTVLGPQLGARPRDLAASIGFADGLQLTAHLRFFNAAGPSPWSDGGLFRWDATPPTFAGPVMWVGTTSSGVIELAATPMSDDTSGPRFYRAGYRLADAGRWVDDFDVLRPSLPFRTSLCPGTWEVQLTAVDQADNETTVEGTGRFSVVAATSVSLDAGLPCAFCSSANSWVPLQPVPNAAAYFTMNRAADGGAWQFSYRANGTPVALTGSGVAGRPLLTRVCVLFTDGGASDWVQIPGVRVYDPDPPSAPASVSASVLDAGVVLDWPAATDAISGVSSYVVERRPEASLLWTARAVVSDTRLVDLPGPGAWRYRVLAVDAAGNASTPTETRQPVVLASPDATPPTVPGVPLSREGAVVRGPVTLEWAASMDDDGGGVTYEVERLEAGQAAISFATPGPSTVEVLAPGRYRWRVRAVDGAQNRSGFSTESLPVEVLEASDAGLDGGVDAGDAGDAGVAADAGFTPMDAGVEPRALTVGCGCNSTVAPALLLAAWFGAGARRRQLRRVELITASAA
jgi:hypothetical protein